MAPFATELPEDPTPYRDLFEANPQPMWVLDLETREFLMVNDAAIRRYGYSREEFGALTIDDIHATGDIPALIDWLRALSDGVDVSDGWRHETRDGEILDVELSSHRLELHGRPAVLVQPRDVTAERDRRLLSEAVAGAANAVFISDAEGVIEWINPAFTRLTGYTQEDALGRRPRDLVKSGEHGEAFYQDLWATILAGEVWRGQVVNRRKDGSHYVAAETITPVASRDGRISHFISVHEDITQRAAIEEDLRERIKELRTLYKATQILYETEVPVEDRLQRVVDVLPNGWQRPEITEARLTVGETRVQTSGFTETPWSFSVEIAPKGQPIGHLTVAFTEERQNLDEGPFLKEKGELLDSVARSVGEAIERQRLDILSREITDVIYIMDPGGMVRFCTPSIERATGYARQEFEGANALALIHEEDRDRVKALLDGIVGAAGATGRAEYRIRTRDGEIRHVESVAQDLLDHPGVGGILVTSRDVTERVELEKKVQESQRLEAIGRLAGGVAHDFNNLLTVIRSQTDLLLLDLEPSDPATAELEVIQAACTRAATLTSHLLSFSRDQFLRPRLVILGEVVRETVELVKRVIGENIRIDMDLGGDGSAVEVDPGQLEQAVLNLAVNARDAMPRGGILRLRTFREEVGEEVARTLGDLDPGSYNVLQISDTGTGMDESTRSRIFQPFFTTKAHSGGTGLGLAMAYGFVKQSNGAIHVESTPGEGTTFFLRFPAVDAPPEELVAPAHQDISAGGTPGTVLVVEDQANVRRLIVTILQRAGLDVVEAEDAEGGLDLLEGGARVDLVLTDLGLPGVSGQELAIRVREAYPHLPIVVMSGYAIDSPGHPTNLPTDIPFLQKPFTRGDLIQVVRGALGEGGSRDVAASPGDASPAR